MRIGIDMDGVVADFNEGFTDLMRTKLGKPVPSCSDTFPDVWEYHKPYVAAAEEEFLWSYVNASSSGFWDNLSPCAGAMRGLLKIAASLHDNYFITTRTGTGAKRQTELWLCRRGIPLPSVLIAPDPSSKGRLAAGLALDMFIDDRPENVAAVVAESPKTRCFLVDQPYNRHSEIEGVTRVSGLSEFAGLL